MDDLDRRIINGLQGGFPLSGRPFGDAAEDLGTTEDALIDRLEGMLNDGRLSRFGPLFNIEQMGGRFCLAR